MKLCKTMVGGKWLKVNGKFILSNGWFAYDGCHKIYILETQKDIKLAMDYSYRLYPIVELEKTYKRSCPLKFIENISLTKYYVKQGERARWSEVKATDTEIEKWCKENGYNRLVIV